MNDVQNQTDKRNIDIQKVGVKDVEIPLVIQRKLKNGKTDTQRVYARAKMSVSLMRQYKGTHMSRFIEILNDISTICNQLVYIGLVLVYY